MSEGDDEKFHVHITSDGPGHDGSLDLPVQLSTPQQVDPNTGEPLVPINPHKLTPASKRAMRAITFTFIVFFVANVIAIRTYESNTAHQLRANNARANAKVAVTAARNVELAKKVALEANARARCEAWDEVHASNQITFGPYSSEGLNATGKQVRENFNQILAARIIVLNKKLGPRPPC